MIYARQNTEAGQWLRKLRREAWQELWRAERIVVRESTKVTIDTMIYGTGFLQQGRMGKHQRDGSDIVRRLEPETVFIQTSIPPETYGRSPALDILPLVLDAAKRQESNPKGFARSASAFIRSLIA